MDPAYMKVIIHGEVLIQLYDHVGGFTLWCCLMVQYYTEWWYSYLA